MEKAASRAKTSGSNNAFAALVKDCGQENPFAKFLGPICVGASGGQQNNTSSNPGQQIRQSINHRYERHV